MSTLLEKVTIKQDHWSFNAFVFIPSPEKELTGTFAMMTHGYTSHKASILNWAVRVVEEGVPTILFDIPGHLQGSFHEVESFEDFKREAHTIFVAAYDKLKEVLLEKRPLDGDLIDDPDSTLVTVGHSMGGLLSLKALELEPYSNRKTFSIAVGFGLPPERVVHVFTTPFYKSTLNIRSQLVSQALDPNLVFPWIREEKEKLKATNKEVLMITGEDDFVVGKEGSEAIADYLNEKGNHVTVQRPKKLPHHLPEQAAALIKKALKDRDLL